MKALALLFWMLLPIHRMTFVAMPSCGKLKWVPCDFYGRVILPDGIAHDDPA